MQLAMCAMRIPQTEHVRVQRREGVDDIQIIRNAIQRQRQWVAEVKALDNGPQHSQLALVRIANKNIEHESLKMYFVFFPVIRRLKLHVICRIHAARRVSGT